VQLKLVKDVFSESKEFGSIQHSQNICKGRFCIGTVGQLQKMGKTYPTQGDSQGRHPAPDDAKGVVLK
jgi:hypothetical protein